MVKYSDFTHISESTTSSDVDQSAIKLAGTKAHHDGYLTRFLGLYNYFIPPKKCAHGLARLGFAHCIFLRIIMILYYLSHLACLYYIIMIFLFCLIILYYNDIAIIGDDIILYIILWTAHNITIILYFIISPLYHHGISSLYFVI